jgi:hypothetical protein
MQAPKVDNFEEWTLRNGIIQNILRQVSIHCESFAHSTTTIRIEWASELLSEIQRDDKYASVAIGETFRKNGAKIFGQKAPPPQKYIGKQS